MKTTDLLVMIFDDNSLLVNSSIVGIYSKKELYDFCTSARLICGCMKNNSDYYVTEKPLSGIIADAVFRDHENEVITYCYILE